jgi:hypothetical protein
MRLFFNNGKWDFKLVHIDNSDSVYEYREYVFRNIVLILKINKITKEVKYWQGINCIASSFEDRLNKNYISDSKFNIIINYFTGQLQFINKSIPSEVIVEDDTGRFL